MITDYGEGGDIWSKIGYLLITGGWYMGYNRGGLAWGQLTNYAFVAQCSLHADYVGDHDDHNDEDEVSTGDYCQLCPWIPHTWILHICPFWYPIALVTPKKYTKNAQIHDKIAKNVQNGRFLRYKVHQLEKSTPPPVLGVLTNISYAYCSKTSGVNFAYTSFDEWARVPLGLLWTKYAK